jgi:hypothetical protein
MTAILTAIFFISAATLGLELVLVRALSIGHWHHFSYLVISTALLGFGAGGTVVSIGSKFLAPGHRVSLWGLALGFAVAVPIVFHVSQKVPFDELQLIWDRRQILYLFAYYLLFFVPFFCAGSFIALAFTIWADRAPRLYFYNMIGSGLGAAGIVILMYGNSPQTLLLIISATAFFAALILAFQISRQFIVVTVLCSVICLFAFCSAGPFALGIEISEHKSLVYYGALPDAETLAVRYSPLARLDCLEAPGIRHFPGGFSFAYRGDPPPPQQILIISDADGVTAINHFDTLDDLGCLRYATSALAYHLLSEPNVCIIGAGGGSDVAQALALGTRHVTAVEMNSQVVDLVRNQFNEFASALYGRADVEVVVAEGRNFLQTTDQLFDIINISLLDSFSASAAGLYALNESHLYTIEAVEQALARLQPNGALSITRMLKPGPPRDSLKMLATIAEALRRDGISDPAKHIIVIRSLATATMLVSPQPLSDGQVTSARKFARDCFFDLVHLPGIEPDEVNQFHELAEPVYYEAAQQILSPQYKAFYDSYVYDIRPATDDRPYFFDFFKWKSLPYMIRSMPRQWLRLSEWGYLILTATLLQAALASALFIVLPLCVAKPIKAVGSGKLATLGYFLLLGLAYMFLEMGFIQKLTLLIGHPVFGVAVTLVGFLVFSGFGSLASERTSYLVKRISYFASCLALHPSPVRLIRIAVSAIIFLGIIEIGLVTFGFDWLVGFARPTRILLGLAITGPTAFFMGIPFPTALKSLHTQRGPLIPWAWGVNGFASVTGAVLGTFLAISVGFTTLALVALGCYFLAAVVSKHVF